MSPNCRCPGEDHLHYQLHLASDGGDGGSAGGEVGAPVTDKEVQEVFAPWGKWRFLAYWFWDWEG